MSEVLNIDFRKGTLIEKHSKLVGVNVGNSITRQQKGLAYAARQANSGQVTFPNMTALNFGTGAFSIVCAFKMGEFINIGSGLNTIFASGTVATNSGISFHFGSAEVLTLEAANAANRTTLLMDDLGAINDGKYHLIYFTFDGVTYKGYSDNLKETTELTTVRDIDTAQSFFVGRDGLTNRRSNSDVAYIKAYDHEITEQERSKLYSEFLNSSLIQKQKSGFVYPKADENHDAGIVAAYNMVPVDGVIADISGNGNTGTISGALQSLEGMNFDGGSDIVSLASSVNIGKSHTILVRFKPKFNMTIGNNGTLFYDGVLHNYPLRFFEGTLRYQTETGGTTGVSFTPVDTEDNFTDIVIIRDGLNVEMIQDGNSLGTDTLSINADQFIHHIGNKSDLGLGFNGTIADIKIYNYTFTAQQAKDYHNQFANRVALKEDFSDNAVGDTL